MFRLKPKIPKLTSALRDSNMSEDKYILCGIEAPFDAVEEEIFARARQKILKAGIPCSAYDIKIYKKSIDARHRGVIKAVCSVSLDFSKDGKIYASALEKLGAKRQKSGELNIIKGEERMKKPPLVVGMGPAGMFCALLLASEGYCPVLIDRGDCVAARTAAVERFYKFGVLDPDSNIQFGAGGAGTFSDGKLMTRINDPLVSYVLEKFYEFGAPKEILLKAKPHIGTDILSAVVENILQRIKDLGGKVIYRCRLERINERENGEVEAVTNHGDIDCSCCVLALGHSARDTYKMLLDEDFDIIGKPFSVGVRIEHRREDIEKALFGKYAGHPALGAAEYALSDTGTDRGVYTFCMCPGGEVVAAASEEGGVVVNGMSRYKRDGVNSNSAVAVSVKLSDIEPVDGSAVLGAIAFQRSIEMKAFSEGGSDYRVPVQTVGDFLKMKEGSKPGRIMPTYMGGDRYKLSDVDRIFPEFITDALRYGILSFDRKIKGFACGEAVLSAPETRTSSPLRILRTEELTALGKRNIYPCGEGAGYAGGITSAAVDGVKVALEIMKRWQA